MEVTTVSPSPASPTGGDDLCETDVTSVAIDSVTLLICLCGLVENGAVLCLLTLKRHNTVISFPAFVDFLFLLFTVPYTLLCLVEDVSCSHITDLLYLNFLSLLSAVSYYWVLFCLTLRSNIVYMDRLYKLCCRCNFSERWLLLVYSIKFWVFFALFIVISALTNPCPSHQQEHCRAALMSLYTLILFLFAAPTVIPSTINFISARWGSHQQPPKRRDIIIFLIVFLILLLSLCNFLQKLGYTVVSSKVLLLLNCIHSSIKPFIYFLAGGFQWPCSLRSLRLSLQKVFD